VAEDSDTDPVLATPLESTPLPVTTPCTATACPEVATLATDVAVLTAQSTSTCAAVEKLTAAILGNGKTGLVVRMDRIERAHRWIARAFWIVTGSSLAGIVGLGIRRAFGGD